jgi:hypothetical protein
MTSVFSLCSAASPDTGFENTVGLSFAETQLATPWSGEVACDIAIDRGDELIVKVFRGGFCSDKVVYSICKLVLVEMAWRVKFVSQCPQSVPFQV